MSDHDIRVGALMILCGCRAPAPEPSTEGGEGWNAPCEVHGTVRNCFIGCPGVDANGVWLVDVPEAFSRMGAATFKYDTNDVRGVKRDWDDLTLEELARPDPHLSEALSHLLPRFGFTFKQDGTDTNLYHIIRAE